MLYIKNIEYDKYYPQIYLEECKYQERNRKKKRMEKNSNS